MYNFNGSKKKKQLLAGIALVLIAAMIITSIVAAFL